MVQKSLRFLPWYSIVRGYYFSAVIIYASKYCIFKNLRPHTLSAVWLCCHHALSSNYISWRWLYSLIHLNAKYTCFYAHIISVYLVEIQLERSDAILIVITILCCNDSIFSLNGSLLHGFYPPLNDFFFQLLISLFSLLKHIKHNILFGIRLDVRHLA